MKLEELSVTNFRSITKAYKIKMSNFTVLVGKNNEGKSNFLLALKIALESIKEYSTINLSKTKRYKSFDKMYIWDRDFPIQLQNNTSKAKTIFDVSLF